MLWPRKWEWRSSRTRGVENELNQRKRCLRTDNGGEYTLQEFDDYLKVRHPFSCSHNTLHSKMELQKGRRAKLVEAWCMRRTYNRCFEKKKPQAKLAFRYQHWKVFGCVRYVFWAVTDEAGEEGGYASWCIFVGYDQQRLRCIDPTTKSVSPHVVFDEASSWWSSENVVLPDSGMLDFRMRAQAPEQQEPDIVSNSGPESKKSATRSPPVRKKSPRPATRQQRVMHAALEESNKIFKRIPAEGTVLDSRLRRSTRIRKPNQSQVYRSQLCRHCDTFTVLCLSRKWKSQAHLKKLRAWKSGRMRWKRRFLPEP